MLSGLSLLAALALAVGSQVLLPVLRDARILERLEDGTESSVLAALERYRVSASPELERAITAAGWTPTDAIAEAVLETDSEVIHRALLAKGWRPGERLSDPTLNKLTRLGATAMPVMLIAMQDEAAPSNTYSSAARRYLIEHDPGRKHLAKAVEGSPKRYRSVLLLFAPEIASVLGRKETLLLMRGLLDDVRVANAPIITNGKTYEQRVCDLGLAAFAKLAGPNSGLSWPVSLQDRADSSAWETRLAAARDWLDQLESGAVKLDPGQAFVRFDLRGLTTTGEAERSEIQIQSKSPDGQAGLSHRSMFQFGRYNEVLGPWPVGAWIVTVIDRPSGKFVKRTIQLAPGQNAVFAANFAAAADQDPRPRDSK